MRIIKPSWLAHSHGDKAAEIYTVGISPDGKRLVTGGFDGMVRVWSTAATRDPTTDQPRQLASMSSHTGSVVVTRFSPNGRYVASGSDDKLVLIWELDASRTPHKEFGTNDNVHEVWTARKKLADHKSDVQDLAWSPDGALLVTVSLDSAIIIWSGTTFEKLASIDIHDSHVKGVAFDPANKYFITCADDRSARIVRYQGTAQDFSYSIEATIEAPFKHSPLTTFFRRCSWSPDGETIACPNSTNGPVPTVCIIDRGSWEAEVSLVGHEGPVEVCLFSPRAYNMGPDPVTIVASAGTDGTIAIWSTSSPRPLLVVSDVASKSITDLAWTPDGLGLYAASLDGTISLVLFDELGTVLPQEQVQKTLLKYGSAQTEMDLPESAEQLRVREREGATDGANGGTAEPAAATTATAATPVALPAPATAVAAAVPESAPKTVRPQVTSITKDGRKRVTPMLISQQAAPTQLSSEPSIQPPSLVRAAPSADFTRPQSGVPKGGVQTLVVGTKRRAEEDESASKKEPKKEPKKLPEFIRPAVLNPACVVSSARLAVPRVFTHISHNANASVIEARNGTDFRDPARISVSHDGKPVFVDFLAGYAHVLAGSGDYFWAAATEDGTLYTWSPQGVRLLPPLALGSSVVLLSSKNYSLVAVTATGLVQAWDLEAKRALFPAVSLAPILDCSSKYSDGVLRAPSVTQCWMSNNAVVVTLNNGNAYAYSADLQAWSRVSEPFWAYGSQYWDSTGFASMFDSSGSVAISERRTNEEVMLKNSARGKQMQRMARNRMLQDGYNGFEDSVSIAHLEVRIASAVMLESPELEKYLDLYVNRLGRDGHRGKMAELLRKLSHTDKLGGLDSKKLLRRALDLAATHRPVQTLVVEYEGADDMEL